MRVFPSPLPRHSQGNTECKHSCLLGRGRGTSQASSVQRSHLPDLSTLPPATRAPSTSRSCQRQPVQRPGSCRMARERKQRGVTGQQQFASPSLGLCTPAPISAPPPPP